MGSRENISRPKRTGLQRRWGLSRPLGAACPPVAPQKEDGPIWGQASPPIVESSVPNRKHPDDGQCCQANTNNAWPFPRLVDAGPGVS